ncbi:hypothetical protein BASA81_013711 [Batrachochytrium salamandrivorans]|nr:hypothetical protein BASA81_013711 [Batrachochytrium salamandrivorans]
MDQRYLNSTATELATMNRVCIICREEMVAVPGNVSPDEAVGIAARAAVGVAGAAVSPHRINPNTPNGFLWQNVFHFRCLRSWIERQTACPTRNGVIVLAQAPVQPAIVNPVACRVKPVVGQANDNVPQPAGAVHPHQYPQALPAANCTLVVSNPVQRTSVCMGFRYLISFNILAAPPVQMDFLGGHGWLKAPIYLTFHLVLLIVDANA